MFVRIAGSFRRLSLAKRFMLASMIILVAGTVGIGQWVGDQIEAGVVHRTATTTALYVGSFVAPYLQELGQSDALSAEHVAALSKLLQNTPLGRQIVAFKVWDTHGKVLYSNETSIIGQVYPLQQGLAQASTGQVSTRISSLEKAENEPERARQSRLLETYSPVWLSGTDHVIAVAEFYQEVDDLQQEINTARQRSWLVVSAAMIFIYLCLAGFVHSASETIQKDEKQLQRQVFQLTGLLRQNQELHERVRGAAARSADLNERFLRRMSAELHDGPVQDVSLALLTLGNVTEQCMQALPWHANLHKDLSTIQASLERSLQETREILNGLGLPLLSQISLEETVRRAVHDHERRTHSRVRLSMSGLPNEAPLSVKITLYRVVQEALTNAFRHADGAGQQVRVENESGRLCIEISDHGPGFASQKWDDWDHHLGLAGMRERVESLGGYFSVQSQPGQGTCVLARLDLQREAGTHG